MPTSWRLRALLYGYDKFFCSAVHYHEVWLWSDIEQRQSVCNASNGRPRRAETEENYCQVVSSLRIAGACYKTQIVYCMCVSSCFTLHNKKTKIANVCSIKQGWVLLSNDFQPTLAEQSCVYSTTVGLCLIPMLAYTTLRCDPQWRKHDEELFRLQPHWKFVLQSCSI